MNILQMEDLVKGMPDEMLMQEAQMPSGQIPQFLALSEVQRRKEMRDKFQAPPQATVADQILQSGIASAMPQQPPQGGMAPPQGAPMGAPQGPVMAYGGGRMPYGMADGGAVPGGPVGANEQAAVLREAQSGKARFADFLRQNLTTPQGLGRLAAGAIGTSVGGPLAGYAASAGFNRLFPMGPTAVESAQQKAYQAMNPFNTYGKEFSQAGADRQAELDQAGAMALGNRYQDYLNRMTNPFAGTGSGIVRDERLGDQSLNLDDYGMGMAAGGYVPGTIFMQAGQQVDIYKLANLSPTDRERIARQYQRLGMNADFVLNPQTFDALPLDKRKQLFERLMANEAASPQSNASAPGNLEQYTGAYGRLQGTPDIRLLIEQGSADQIKTAFAESIQAGDDQTASVIQSMAVGRGKADQGELQDIGKQLRLLRGQQQSSLRASEKSAAAEQDRLAQQNRANYLLTGQEPPPAAVTPVAAAASPPAAPAGTAAPPAGGAAPPVSGMDIAGANVDITTLFPQARGVVGGRGSGMPQDLAAGMKPYEDILAVDPNAAVFKGTDFTSLIEQQQKRGAERAASYEQTIKGIENEMKRERLGAVLTTLGANLMAGEGALGLEKAGALAQQIGKETRQEIAAERRAARTAEDATSDRIFALNAQQLTSDTEAQRALYTAQRGVKEKALEFLQKDIGNRQQAEQAANQLAATLTVSMVNSIRDKVVSEGADRRSALSFAQYLAKEQFEILSANPQLAAMPKEELQNLINQTMRAALETAFSAVGTALPPTFNTGGPRQGSTAQSRPPLRDVGSNYKEG